MASITSYIAAVGGQTITVPNGTYTGGTDTTVHSSTLVLKAETQGGVIVDTNGSNLTLNGTTKVIFIGFAFVDTMVSVRNLSADIDFWYCDFTFPPTSYTGADYPNPLRILNVGGGNPARVRALGSDFHDIGDDGIQIGNSTDVTVTGCKFSNVSNHGTNTSLWHNDAIQWTAGTNQTASFCDFEGHIQAGEDAGAITNLNISDAWCHDSPNVGFIYERFTGKATVTGSRARIYSWNHALGVDRYDYKDGVQHAAGSIPTDVNVTDSAITTSAPGGGVTNPADVWRTANPYSSWSAFFGFGTPPPAAEPVPFIAALSDDALSSTSYTAVQPGGASVGDIGLIAVGITNNATVPTTPSGWTLVKNQRYTSQNGSPDYPNLYVYAKDLTAGDLGASVGLTASASVTWCVSYALYRAGNLPVDASGGAFSFGGYVAPTVTTTAPASRLISVWLMEDGLNPPGWTAPASMTSRVDFATSYLRLLIADEALSAAGATGTRTASTTGSYQAVMVTLAIDPTLVSASAALSATATLTATSTPATISGSAALAASGTLAANGVTTAPPIVSGSAALAAVGTLTAAATATTPPAPVVPVPEPQHDGLLIGPRKRRRRRLFGLY